MQNKRTEVSPDQSVELQRTPAQTGNQRCMGGALSVSAGGDISCVR